MGSKCRCKWCRGEKPGNFACDHEDSITYCDRCTDCGRLHPGSWTARERRAKEDPVTTKPTKTEIMETTRRVGYEGHYCVIIPDHAAGRPKRYSVYRLPSSPSRPIKVIGRELPLGHARKVAAAVGKPKEKPKCNCVKRKKSYSPCDECGVRGCNIHQVMGWARPPCPVHR
jgi:hypothetical protein